MLLWALCLPPTCPAAGNERIESLATAKRLLHHTVYADHRRTLYCGIPFQDNGIAALPVQYRPPAALPRAARVEWEHAVPAEHFGRNFAAWRHGHPRCRDRQGRPFRGRACARKVSREYRRMQADMHNLFPALGLINAARANFDFRLLPGVPPAFAFCAMKIARRHAEPPDRAKGIVARAALYMQASYAHFRLSRQQEQLFQTWDRLFPPDRWECERNRRITRLQGNDNPFLTRRCAP